MMYNPYYSEARAVPSPYGTFTGGNMPGVPMAGTPMTGTPMTGAPMTGTPMTGAPMTGTPMNGTSMQSVPPGPVSTGGGPVFEESYIENILRLNLGKQATLYMTYENNSEWNAKIFKGIIEAAGRDHIIISDPSTGMRFLLLMINLDYITFTEELNYSYPPRKLTQSFG